MALRSSTRCRNRIHPAESRINRLADETPARFRAFDLLTSDDEVLLERPFRERRAALVNLISGFEGATEDGPGGWTAGTIELTPLTLDPAAAEPWLENGEGVIAKELEEPYRPGERKGMVKIKRLRTIDAVVAGWRPGKEPNTVGALMLGLYDDEDNLRVIGHSSGLKAAEKRELVGTLAPYETGDRGSGGSKPLDGGPRPRMDCPAPGAGDRGVPSTTSPPAASVMAQRSSAGAMTRPQSDCKLDQLDQ